MPTDNIICTGIVQADNQSVPAIIRATQSGGVYTIVVGGGSAPSDIPDGTYKVGLGVTNDGTITFLNGRITAIQQAS